MALLTFAGAEDSLLEVNAVGTVQRSTAMVKTGSYSFGCYHTFGEGISNNCALIDIPERATVILQAALFTQSTQTLSSLNEPFMAWKNGGTILGCLTVPYHNNSISAWTGDRTTLLGQFSSGVSTTTWALLEMKIVMGASGSIEIRLNQKPMLAWYGNTIPGTETVINRLVFGNLCSYGSNVDWTFWDDIIVCDDQGGNFNTWLNGIRFHKLSPIGQGTYTEWTPYNKTTNWTCINEDPVNTTSYVVLPETDVGKKDSYLLSSAPSEIQNIKGTVQRYWGEGEGIINPLLRIGGIDYIRPSVQLPLAIGFVDNVEYISPATGKAFSLSEFSGIETGMVTA